MRTLLLALVFLAAVLVPAATQADDQDIVPERLTLRRFKLVSWDPQMGILYGTISGEAAGTGAVTVVIQAATRIRRASIPRSLPNNPVRTDLENWNAVWASTPGNPIKTFGAPAAPNNPCSPILTSMVTNLGYVRLKLNSDLSTGRVIKPYYPPVPI